MTSPTKGINLCYVLFNFTQLSLANIIVQHKEANHQQNTSDRYPKKVPTSIIIIEECDTTQRKGDLSNHHNLGTKGV